MTSSGTSPKTRRRGHWDPILDRAAVIVESYDTGVTLRQLFYRLVAEQLITNTRRDYQDLSRRTAELRRDDVFPELVDRRRSVDRPPFWNSAARARAAIRAQFRMDRTEGQPWSIYVGCEKDALSALLARWMDDRGVPVIILGGWSSEGYERAIKADIASRDRPSVLLYLGDLDPAGEGIEANVQKHVGFDRIIRIGLTLPQKVAMGLPENADPDALEKLDRHPGRIPFMAKYRRLFQVEVDAIDPDVLRDMVDDAVDAIWDQSAYDVVMDREKIERAKL